MSDLEMGRYAVVALGFVLVGILAFFAIPKSKDIVRRLSPRPVIDEPDLANTNTLPLPDLYIVDAEPRVTIVHNSGRRPGDTRHRLSFDLTSATFFEATSGGGREGHFVIMTRAGAGTLETGQYRGTGAICGTIYPGDTPVPPGHLRLKNQFCWECWQVGVAPDGWESLKPESVTPPMVDGQTYRVVIETEPAPGGWALRLQVNDHDSGPMFSDNSHIDPTSQVIAFAVVTPAGSLRLTNMQSSWSAA